MKKSNILRRSISLFLTMIMVFSLLTGLSLQSSALDPAEMLTDGSFDTPATVMTDGTLPSLGIWTTMSWASVLSEPENAHTGNGLAHLVYNSPELPANEYPTIYQDVAVETNTDYQVSFYTKRWSTSEANAPLYYGYRNALADVWTPVEQFSIDTVGPEYQKISFTFNSGALTRVRIFAFVCSINTGDAGGYHVDDFSMQKFVYDGGMLVDASFNRAMTPMTDGTLPSVGAWTAMSWASALNEPENAHSGSGLAHLVFDSPALPANEYPTIYQDVAVTPGANYEVSFYAKKWATADQSVPLYYGYRNALADVWTPVEQFMEEDIDTDYLKITFTFNAANLTTVRIFAFVCSINTGGAGGYHIDDFFMREIPEDNMLADGSFNLTMTPMTDGTLPSVGAWTAMSWASSLNEPENAHSGNGLAHLVFDSPALPANEYPTIYQDVVVTPGADYEVSFYAKKWATAEQSVPLYYGYRNALEDVWTPVEQFVEEDIDTDYQKITFTFNAANLTTVRIFAFVCSINTGDAGGYHIDDFFMRELVEDNLLEDGSFNLAMTPITDGTLPSVGTWTSMSWASAINEPENAHSGANLANLIYNAPELAAGEFPTIYQDVDVEQDTIYRLTFYAKCWTPLGAPIQPLYYGLRNALTDVWTPVRQLSVDDLTNSYQKITLLFDSQQMTCVRIFAFTESIATQEYGGYHLDDFKLVKLCGEEDCPHEYAVVATEPTCTEAGNTGDTYCLICGEKIAEGTVIPATGHTPGEPVTENEVTATCTTAGGYDTVIYCTVCEAEISRQHTDIPAPGHTPGEPVTENEVTATCTTAGGYDTVIYCTVCEAEISRNHTNIPALGHDYELTAWNWSGVTSAAAVFTCKNDASHVETVVATIESVRTEPTAEENGSVVYTASVTFEDVSYTDTKTEILPATGHDYELSAWDWTDYTAATATFIDKNGGSPIIINASITSVRTEPTCVDAGRVDYTASVIFDGVTYTDTMMEPLPALGHTPGEPVTENEVDATCTTAGGYDTVVYCTVCKAEISREHTNISALGHDWNEPTYVWAEDNGSVTATHTCKRDESHTETEKVNTTSEVTKEATYEEEGEITYTATFTNPAFQTQIKKVATPKIVKPVLDNPFKDVKEGEFYYDAVLWAVNAQPQVTAGTSATTFSPNDTCTRAQVVTFLWRAKGCPEPKSTNNPFKDVKGGEYYYKAVLWAVENNITAGTSATTFSPNAGCTRAQVVTFLWRTEGQPKPTSTSNPFKDVPAGQYFTTAVLWAVEKNITKGTGATTFSPNDTCTRGQIVTFLYRDLA